MSAHRFMGQTYREWIIIWTVAELRHKRPDLDTIHKTVEGVLQGAAEGTLADAVHDYYLKLSDAALTRLLRDIRKQA